MSSTSLNPRKAILLLVAASLIVIDMGRFWMIHESAKFPIIQVETTLSWSDGPNIKLNDASIAKLNAELDQITDREMPGKGIHYPVVSLDERRVEVMYIGSYVVPEALQKTLNEHIKKRLPELAREQVLAEQSK